MTGAAIGVVDTHAHIISSDPTRFPYAPASGALPDWPPERFVDADKLLARMTAAGVDRAVLVQYSSAHGYDNRYVLATAGEHPERFVAVCTLDGLQSDAPDQLTACVRQGASGLRIRARGREGGLDWLTCEPLWQRAAELHVPVCVHFMENVQAEGLELLPSLLSQFPTLPVVLDHAGNPPWREGPPWYGMQPVLELARFDQLIIKFATINLERLHLAQVEPHIALERLVGTFGANRIMWGSDAPNTPGDYTEMLSWMRSSMATLSEADRTWMLAGTALRVYPKLVEVSNNHVGVSIA
ncbi:MAG: amidohydrolase family protein [Chloroflexi bacterium]|nr:amidohydrolase family protein [Chloroflexota bacterium]